MAFSDRELQLISETPEVRIETHGNSRSYRTIIWVVVDDGEVLVRSVRGEKGKWYRRVLENPEVVLEAASIKIPARAVPATDASSIERTSEALRRKYKKGRSLDSMLKPEILETTLRLDPA
ncbi:MAG: DUF2255 family protein [Acidimicrobiia bacterium]